MERLTLEFINCPFFIPAWTNIPRVESVWKYNTLQGMSVLEQQHCVLLQSGSLVGDPSFKAIIEDKT